jgi:hypothetical protein
VKIYVAAVEALRKKERQDETQFTTKIDSFSKVFFDVFFKISFDVNSYYHCIVEVPFRMTLLWLHYRLSRGGGAAHTPSNFFWFFEWTFIL